MDKMTNDERRRIAGIIRSIRSEIHASCKITTRELAMERLDQLADEIDAPEREYPTGEWKLSQDGNSLFHNGTTMARFPTFMEEVDKRMLRKAKEMYKFIKGRGPQHRTDEESFLLDYIETGANNESSK